MGVRPGSPPPRPLRAERAHPARRGVRPRESPARAVRVPFRHGGPSLPRHRLPPPLLLPGAVLRHRPAAARAVPAGREPRLSRALVGRGDDPHLLPAPCRPSTARPRNGGAPPDGAARARRRRAPDRSRRRTPGYVRGTPPRGGRGPHVSGGRESSPPLVPRPLLPAQL